MFCHTAHGQTFKNIIQFTTQNGLTNNNITCLAKDYDGFLWIGTHEGLNQYDGTEFIPILSNSKNNLPSNSINKICCINATTLFVATAGGLCMLNTKTLEGRTIELPSFLPGQKSYTTWDLLYNKKDTEAWVATSEGLYVLSDKGILKRKIVCKLDDPNGAYAYNLFKDKNNNVFFYSQKHNGFYYPDFLHDKLVPIETILPEFVLNRLIASKYFLRSANFIDDKIICCYSTVNSNKKSIIAFYDNSSGKSFVDSIDASLTNNYVLYNAFPLSDSSLLINSYFGEPYLFNIHSHGIKPASSQPLWFTSWPDGIGVKLLTDKQNIWAASSKGLLQIPQYPDIFKTNTALVQRINSSKPLISYNYGIYLNGKFWVSCLGSGLYSLDTLSDKIQQVFDTTTPLQFRKKVISNDLQAVGKNIWLFSVYGPIEVNTTSLKMNVIQANNKDSLFDDKASSPYRDKNGNIWLTIPSGVSKYIPGTNSFINYYNKAHGGTFPTERGFYKTGDGNGNIWFAKKDTLVKFDPVANHFTVMLLKRNGSIIQPVEGIASNGNDLLYLYLNGAFAVFNIYSGTLELYTKQTGIVSTTINQLVTDRNGNPWMATEGGLLYYNRNTRHFYSYTRADGLPDDNVISLNFTDSTKTTLFLGFPRSYCIFNPETLLSGINYKVQNTITGVEVNGEAITLDEGKTFSYKQNNISFFYTGINFTAGQQNSYAYMLQGIEKDWTYCGKKRQCNYVNLPPGKYIFKIKSANQQGEWNEDPASFSFRISAPFWQTWWFRMLAAILATILIYRFIKRRDAIKEKENKVALQMSELKLTALQSQMNPHFIFNSLNSIQNYIMQQKPIEAARYLSKFSKLIRRVLDQSFDNLTSLSEIEATLRMYLELEAFRFSNEFVYEIKIDDPESINNIKLPPLILQPYVENAIIHGLLPKDGEKKLFIHFYKRNGELHCVIDDNGIGRSEQLEGTETHISRGQKLTTDMLTTMKQLLHTEARINIVDKRDDFNNLAGTTVELIVPLDIA